jgi:hypothetical protein
MHNPVGAFETLAFLPENYIYLFQTTIGLFLKIKTSDPSRYSNSTEISLHNSKCLFELAENNNTFSIEILVYKGYYDPLQSPIKDIKDAFLKYLEKKFNENGIYLNKKSFLKERFFSRFSQQ